MRKDLNQMRRGPGMPVEANMSRRRLSEMVSKATKDEFGAKGQLPSLDRFLILTITFSVHMNLDSFFKGLQQVMINLRLGGD